jgi:hypothetical protein
LQLQAEVEKYKKLADEQKQAAVAAAETPQQIAERLDRLEKLIIESKKAPPQLDSSSRSSSSVGPYPSRSSLHNVAPAASSAFKTELNEKDSNEKDSKKKQHQRPRGGRFRAASSASFLPCM